MYSRSRKWPGHLFYDSVPAHTSVYFTDTIEQSRNNRAVRESRGKDPSNGEPRRWPVTVIASKGTQGWLHDPCYVTDRPGSQRAADARSHVSPATLSDGRSLDDQSGRGPAASFPEYHGGSSGNRVARSFRGSSARGRGTGGQRTEEVRARVGDQAGSCGTRADAIPIAQDVLCTSSPATTTIDSAVAFARVPHAYVTGPTLRFKRLSTHCALFSVELLMPIDPP